jgi:hypothetical protein
MTNPEPKDEAEQIVETPATPGAEALTSVEGEGVEPQDT